MPAPLEQVVTPEPTVLANTVAGTRYAVQNQSGNPIRVTYAAALPKATDPSYVILPWKTGYPEAEPGESLYVWGENGGKVAYSEAP